MRYEIDITKVPKGYVELKWWLPLLLSSLGIVIVIISFSTPLATLRGNIYDGWTVLMFSIGLSVMLFGITLLVLSHPTLNEKLPKALRIEYVDE